MDAEKMEGISKETVAIVGISLRFPSSDSISEFWNLLVDGKQGISSVPLSRKHLFETQLGIKAGFLKCPINEFDDVFWGYSPKEAILMDPQHRLLHELVWEALEDAGINPQELEGSSCSVYAGFWRNEYEEILQNIEDIGFIRTFIGNAFSAAVAKISQKLRLTGPSLATESACSSSMVAVHLAYESLILGKTDIAICCGSNLLLKPFPKDLTQILLSPDGRCKPFSDQASGYVRAEGFGVLVLKRNADATKNSDRVWGCIRGSALLQDGFADAVGTPSVSGEVTVMKKALAAANVSPEDVAFVEAHGTATAVGDYVEMAAISEVYGTPLRTKPLLIGSVKGNIGHTESCSGIVGIIKVLLSLYNERIPAQVNCTNINPALNLAAIPAVIPQKQLDWARSADITRIAGVSSFGLTGTLVHVIIEEAPLLGGIPKCELCFKEQPVQLLKISAKTNTALHLLVARYRNRLAESSHNENLTDIVYSANVGRSDLQFRAIVYGETKAQMMQALDNGRFLQGSAKNKEEMGGICFLFDGQGFYSGEMVRSIYESSPVFRLALDDCNDFLKEKYCIDIADIIFAIQEKSEENCVALRFQTGLFCIHYALFKLWNSWGVKPDFVLGHGMGELCAAVCAGILSLQNALYLVTERSLLTDKNSLGKAMVVWRNQVEVRKQIQLFTSSNVMKSTVNIAAQNTENETLISGDSKTIECISDFLQAQGIKTHVMAANQLFHTNNIDTILHKYGEITEGISTQSQTIADAKYISGMYGIILDNPVNSAYWMKHLKNPVHFFKATKTAFKAGCKIFIEIGPNSTLSEYTIKNATVMKLKEIICLPSLHKEKSEWQTLLSTLGKLYIQGIPVNWRGMELYRNRTKLSIPHYPFERKPFWPNDNKGRLENPVRHPLLGAFVSATTAAEIFQNNRFTLLEMPFFMDHRIGKFIIFPAAGYLEICLEAGFASQKHISNNGIFGSIAPVVIENLSIENPWQLNANQENMTIKCIVEKDEKHQPSVILNISIFHLENNSNKTSWVLHSTCQFSHGNSNTLTKECLSSIEILQTSFQQTVTNTLPSTEQTGSFYMSMALRNMNWGEKFKTITKIWRQSEQNLIVEIRCPEKNHDFIFHPVLLDSMFQAVVLFQFESVPPSSILVPKKVGKFLFFKKPDPTHDQYLYAMVVNEEDVGTAMSQSVDCTVYLMDRMGCVISIISKIEFKHTTSAALESVLSQNIIAKPELWEEVWHPKSIYCDTALELSKLRVAVPTSAEFLKNLQFNVNQNQDALTIFNNIDALIHLYILRALMDCGWNPKKSGTVFKEDHLFVNTKIHQKFKKQVHYLLGLLEENGILKNVDKNSWKLVQVFPTIHQLEDNIKEQMCSMSTIQKSFPSILLVQKIGENLTKLLRQEITELEILFPSDDNKLNTPSAKKFYHDYNQLTKCNKVMSLVIGKWLKDYKKSHPNPNLKLRCLEIGAGFGIYTMGTLNMLKENDIEFEYYFTDISPTFFLAAVNAFAEFQPSLVFKKLNIEEDPLSQGFVPEHYDLIIAGDVIHATRDLRESLRHINLMLKPSGFFHLYEQVEVFRLVTFVFGLLDGFWRFKDYSLRVNHCFVSKDIWKTLLREMGMPVLSTYYFGNNTRALFKCVKDCSFESISICYDQFAKSLKVWIVFTRDEDSSEFIYFTQCLSKLKSAGRTYVVVKPNNEYKEISASKFLVNSRRQQDIECMLKTIIRNESVSLEGVLYLWSVSVNCTEQEDILLPVFHLLKVMLSIERIANEW